MNTSAPIAGSLKTLNVLHEYASGHQGPARRVSRRGPAISQRTVM